MRHLRDKATTKTATAVLERELGFFRKRRHRLRCASLKARDPVVRQQGAGQPTHETARRSVDGGQSVLAFGALSDRFDAA